MRLTRRQTLLGATASLLPVPAIAAPEYRLAPRQVADGVWLFEGAQDSIARGNGGAICNIVMLETPEGAVVVDTGGTARHGAALREFADGRLGGVAADGALLIDAMAAPGHSVSPDGTWIIAEPHRTIPGAPWLPEIGRGRPDPQIAAGLSASLADCPKARPIVLFCKTDCWMSWNAVQHIAALGHRDIGWYPGGVDDWADGGRALQPVNPLPLGASLCPVDAVPQAALD